MTTAAAADWETAHQATARIRAGSSTGSGACFNHAGGYAWFLTNAHVVGGSRTATVEIWRDGGYSGRIAGLVAYRYLNDQASQDVAIVAVPLASFAGYVPPAIPLAESCSYAAGSKMITVGCPSGVQAAALPMMIAGLSPNGDRVYLTPGALGGQSGSSVFTPDGSRIVGLIAWKWPHVGDSQYAVAQTLGTIAAAYQQARTNLQAPDANRTLVEWTRGDWRAARPAEAELARVNAGTCRSCGRTQCWGNQCQPRQQQQPFATLPPLNGGADTARLAELERRIASLEATDGSLRAALSQLETEWPRIKAAIDSSQNATLQQAAAEAENKYAALKSDFAAQQAKLAEAVQDDLAEVTEESQGLRDKLREYAGEVLTLKNAVDLAQRVIQEREANPGLSVGAAVKDVLRSELGKEDEGPAWKPLDYVIAIGGTAAGAVGVPGVLIGLATFLIRRKTGRQADVGDLLGGIKTGNTLVDLALKKAGELDVIDRIVDRIRKDRGSGSGTEA